jgi:hypothetical protein
MPTARINYKTAWTVKRPFFLCEVCEELVPRRSNSQKYCDACRQLATSKKVAKYYRKHRNKILKNKARYRQDNRERINEAQRQYHMETKLERPSRPMLREMEDL